MTTLELKLSLIQRLTMINDENLLNKIMELIESANEEKVLFFSHGLKSAIEHAREDIKAGKIVKDEDLEEAMTEWVKEN